MAEPLRTVVFVDGQNFKKNLQQYKFETDPQLRPYRLEERHFLWNEFFQGLAGWFEQRTGIGHRLLRVYWYNAETITPFSIYRSEVNRILQQYAPQFPELSASVIVGLAKKWHGIERERFDKIRTVFEEIQRSTEFLEFRFVGQYAVNPFVVYRLERRPDGSLFYQGTRIGERGVDVGIATDMIAKMPYYDVAVLVSGDYDFIPVVRHLKDSLRQVYQFSISKGIPPKITYLSPWLKGIVDAFGFYDEVELLTKYLNRRSGIPLAILQEIDAHVRSLQTTP